MGQAGVADVYLGRLDKPFACVRMPRRQPSDQHQVDEHIKVSRDTLTGDSKIAGKLGRIQKPALFMGKHRPEATQGFSRYAQSNGWNVAPPVGF